MKWSSYYEKEQVIQKNIEEVVPQNRTLNRTLILGNYFLDFRYEWVLGLN